MIEIAPARADERDALANMFQLYVHDFSELWAGTPRGELGDDGRFEAYGPLDLYWREADRIPLMLRCEGRPVGFALVNAFAHSGLPVDRSMAEFFVVRKHRRSGAGTEAARTIFNRYPGQWEAAVARRNVGALAFWRRAIGGAPGAEAIEEIDARTSEWDGPILRFRTR